MLSYYELKDSTLEHMAYLFKAGHLTDEIIDRFMNENFPDNPRGTRNGCTQESTEQR